MTVQDKLLNIEVDSSCMQVILNYEKHKIILLLKGAQATVYNDGSYYIMVDIHNKSEDSTRSRLTTN